jgi:geranylgeranyl diphosphate synthase, type II
MQKNYTQRIELKKTCIMLPFEEIYNTRKNQFEKFLDTRIINSIRDTFHPKLAESSIYSLKAGGKRIRPVLAISAFLSYTQDMDTENVLYYAAALECIHTYSLIHDDLPSMDNDDMRRGMPTNHKQFSEATAILAGDALNSLGFYLLSQIQVTHSFAISDLLQILHTGAGGPGMVSGQIEDIESENHISSFTEETLLSIHQKKTGKLIQASLLGGNRIQNSWKKKEHLFSEYGDKLGLLFQITDDIIDVEGNAKDLGKTPGKDAAKGKLTFPALYGMELAKKKRDNLKDNLVELAKLIDEDKAMFFQNLPIYIANRKK